VAAFPTGPTTLPSTSPIEFVGTVCLLVSFVVAAWCVAAGIAGNARHNRRLVLSAVYGLYGFFALIAVASALIVYAFITHDYSIKYVALTSDTSMSLSYKITAFWGALEGSLLFWVLVLAAFSAIAVRVNQHRHRDMIGYIVATIMAVQLFFLALLIYVKNPFLTFMTTPPPDGEGLNPLLQNYWMVIHPPALYIGYVAATIPFAFGIGALASGRLDDLWLSSVRAWTLVCFFFLSFGLILGGRWAYEELGWGGYWAWDPVENAGFFPWFTAVAFLHSIIIQEQRGMLKLWNLVLVILTFMLTIFGTFMTRSGIVESVHAFGKDDQLALLFVLFMAVIAVVSFGLVIYRAPKLRAANQFESFTSREFAFLLNNWVLLGCAFFVLFATMFPTISEAFAGKRISVKIPFFNKFMTPLGLVLLVLAGVAPLLAWRRTTTERLLNLLLIPAIAMVATVGALFLLVPATRIRTPIFHDAIELPMQLVCFGVVAFTIASILQEYTLGLRLRMKQTGSDPVTSLLGMVLVKRRKYGGYVVHLGMAVMFIGFAGKAWDTKDYVRVEQGSVQRQVAQRKAELKRELTEADRARLAHQASFSIRGYDFVYRSLVQESDDHKHSTTASVALSRRGDHLATMTPAKWVFHKGGQNTTEVSIHPRMGEDVYIVLDHYDPETGETVFIVFINPLVNWVWIGFLILALGTLICLIPQRLVDRVSGRARTRLGHAADLAILLVTVGLVTLASVKVARGQVPDGATRVAQATSPPAGPAKPPPGMEHEDRASRGGGHDDAAGHASLHRPEHMPTHEGRAVAKDLMKDLVCLCGGCPRESLYDCKCGYASREREIVLQLLAEKDLSTKQGRKAAYDEVVGVFMRRYGGEHVLGEPRNQLSWILPWVAVVGGLGLLFVMGTRWVRRGRAAVPAAPPPVAPDDEYAEKLDDELRDID
jgi:cytochrome c-type biogenesis protein CcmF